MAHLARSGPLDSVAFLFTAHLGPVPHDASGSTLQLDPSPQLPPSRHSLLSLLLPRSILLLPSPAFHVPPRFPLAASSPPELGRLLHLSAVTKPKKIKHKKKKVKLAVLQFYKVDDAIGKVTRLRKECPNTECGAGTFMANHFDRHYCGKCGLTYVYQKQGGGGNLQT